MAITTDRALLCNGAQTSSTTSFNTAAFNLSVAAGALLVAYCSLWTRSVSVSSFSGGGLTWATPVGGNGATGNPGWYWSYAFAPSGFAASSGTVITCNLSGSTDTGASGVFSLNGVDNATPVDVTASQTFKTTASTTWVTPSATVLAGSAICAGVWNESGVIGATVDSPATELHEFQDNWGDGGDIGLYIPAGAGSYTVSGTWTGSAKEIASRIVFKAAAGGGGGPTDIGELVMPPPVPA